MVSKPDSQDPSLRSFIQAPHFRWAIVGCILMLALSLRVSAALLWQAQADREGVLFRFGDSESYWVLAETIADRLPYQYLSDELKIFRAPSYPLFLSTVAWVEPSRTAVMCAVF